MKKLKGFWPFFSLSFTVSALWLGFYIPSQDVQAGYGVFIRGNKMADLYFIFAFGVVFLHGISALLMRDCVKAGWVLILRLCIGVFPILLAVISTLFWVMGAWLDPGVSLLIAIFFGVSTILVSTEQITHWKSIFSR